MAGYKIDAVSGKSVAREKMIAYLNVGTSDAPVWSPMGRRTTSSSISMDYNEESNQDILGNTYNTMKKPIMSQSFDPWDLSGGDEAQEMIANLAIVEQDIQALTNMDMMIAHYWLASDDTVVKHFAERYSACMVKISELGGDGGANLGMSTDVTYGGDRTLGTVAVVDGAAVFTAA